MNKWRTYEWLVYNYYLNINREYSNDWKVTFNNIMIGNSGRRRQIDILISSQSQNMIKVIDCKFYNKRVDIKYVESIIGMLDDLNAHAGVIVSPKGFSKSAYKRANCHGRLELIELDIHDLFPYRFSNNEINFVPCPNCDGTIINNIFSQNKTHSIVNMTGYDIVYINDINDFVKVNIGFCTVCLSQIFYCTQCNSYITISIDDVKKNIVKRCKCNIGYSFYSYINEYGFESEAYKYFDCNGHELLSENNFYQLYY